MIHFLSQFSISIQEYVQTKNVQTKNATKRTTDKKGFTNWLNLIRLKAN